MAITYSPVSVLSGYNIVDINANFEAVATALADALSLSGTAPNTFSADIDLNSNDLLNGGTIRGTSFVQNGVTLDLIEVGVNWLGDWVVSTGYVANDAVLQTGTTYRCILAHTSDTPITKPGTGSAWATYWAVLAAKGTDGAGSGDMTVAVYDTNANNIVDQAEAVPYSGITSLPTTLAGYGITDAQGLHAYLTDIVSITGVQGDLFTFDGTDIVALAAPAAGLVLKSTGVGADLEYGHPLPNRNYAETTTYLTTNSVIPHDNSIPQSSEGISLLSTTITPSSTSARIRISISVPVAGNSTGMVHVFPIFDGQTTNAIGVFIGNTSGSNNYGFPVSGSIEHVPGTASEVTYTLRWGTTNGGHTSYINGFGSAQWGGAMRATLIVEEVA